MQITSFKGAQRLEYHVQDILGQVPKKQGAGKARRISARTHLKRVSQEKNKIQTKGLKPPPSQTPQTNTTWRKRERGVNLTQPWTHQPKIR